MNKLILLLFLIFNLNLSAFSQVNLVPNADFEEFSVCPFDGSQFDGYVKDWYNPTLYSPDYYNNCALSPSCSVPYNFYGYNYARSGYGYAFIGAFDYYVQGREYISIKLNDTLQAGITYCVGFFLNLPSMKDNDLNTGCKLAIDRVGVFFQIHLFRKIPTMLFQQFLN